jgi:predicted Rossmann-fold nucleotide-binding protein
MNDKYLVKVNKIYTSASNIFVEGVDYTLEENTKVISWTATGRAKLPPNNKYYVDIIRKIVDTTDQNVEYYVKEIDKKKIIVTPAARKKLNELTTFEYTTEEYNLLPYEIADVGNINIVIV